ncbi:hypothetical protein [Xanthobacter versatilis]|uniref:hypothetical protein n=1 Tax=Xanthobacter autotrophicus (strain ATCC BAA-1158 / Py2) TaxID=78245 RepID=UPI00372863B4
MANTGLSLGGVRFSDWELPERIPFGGRHHVAVHRMIGGKRVVDALGPDPRPLSWSGRFRGANALSRARSLDTMRASGRQVSCTYMGLHYLVVVTNVNFDAERPYEVPYTVTCEVVQDSAQSVISSVISGLGALMSGDLATATGIITGAVGTAAVSTVSSAVAAAGDLSMPTSTTLAALSSSVSTASSTLASRQVALDAAVVDGGAAGTDPAVLASWLTSTASSVAEEVSVLDAKSYVDRSGVNISLQGQ